MSSSASNHQKGVLFDTNVLSHFAKIERLPLLLQAFADVHRAKQLYISPTLQRELQTGVQHGVSYLQVGWHAPNFFVIIGAIATAFSDFKEVAKGSLGDNNDTG